MSSKEVGLSIIKGGNISGPLSNINFLLFGEGGGGANSNAEVDFFISKRMQMNGLTFSVIIIGNPMLKPLDLLVFFGIVNDPMLDLIMLIRLAHPLIMHQIIIIARSHQGN